MKSKTDQSYYVAIPNLYGNSYRRNNHQLFAVFIPDFFRKQKKVFFEFKCTPMQI